MATSPRTGDTVPPEVLAEMRKWLSSHRVPAKEVSALLESVCDFYHLKADAHPGCKPKVAATATGRREGRVHVSFHVTWPHLQIGVEPHDHLMSVIDEGFTARIGHRRHPHLRAHLMWVPASSLGHRSLNGFVADYAKRESLKYFGVWPADDLVKEIAA